MTFILILFVIFMEVLTLSLCKMASDEEDETSEDEILDDEEEKTDKS